MKPRMPLAARSGLGVSISQANLVVRTKAAGGFTQTAKKATVSWRKTDGNVFDEESQAF
jgi:hypothetical protein